MSEPTPTDGEREDLAHIIRNADSKGPVFASTLADLIVGAGFRRHEAPEPQGEPCCTHPKCPGGSLCCCQSDPEPQGDSSDAPIVHLMARRGGKTQAMIKALLAQANERGIRVEVVYPQSEPTEAAAKVAAQHIAWAASDWTDIEGGTHEHGMYCTNWTAYVDDARAALRAAAQVKP